MNSIKIIQKVPTKLISFERHVGDTLADVNFLLLIIPGNPGIIEFYRHFMDQLSLELKAQFPNETIPVWGISHAGHDGDGMPFPYPASAEFPELYTLNAQVSHKDSFVEQFIPKHVKVILIGHSIGCHISLQLMQLNSDFASQVIKVLMLFPAIQQMQETPNGKLYVSIRPIQRVITALLLPFDYLPTWIRHSLVNTYLYFFRSTAPSCIRDGMITFFQKEVIEKVFAMANCEMTQVLDLDVPMLEKIMDRLFVYFGRTDSWCPLEYVETMKRALPNLSHTICNEGIEHAFVVKDSGRMASILIPEIIGGREQWELKSRI